MKTLTYPTRVRSRDKILASFADLPLSIQGKICDDKRVLASGKTVVYHNLQYWADGKNHTIRIPEGKLQDFREAVKNGAKAKRLLNELSCSDVQTIVSSQPASSLKKNWMTSS